MAADISVLHAIPGLDPRSGGTSRAVVDATDELAQQPGLAISLMYQAPVGQDTLPSSSRVNRIGVPVVSRWAVASGLAFRREMKRQIVRLQPSIVHVHGLWHAVDHWSAAIARRHRVPLVIQPHGMLEAWALQHRGPRKQLAMALYQRRDLEAANLLIASSPREAQSFRRLGLRGPIAVIPHGIRWPQDADGQAGGRRDDVPRTRTVLFLSRLHPVKGLPTLLDAWARLRPVGWRLVIAGPDEGGHLQQVQAHIRRLGIGDWVEYVGEVRDEVKSRLYRTADLFVLPTHTENFGLVIAEALAHGVPVITTKGAPWADLQTHGCGWWVDIGEEPLRVALREAIALSDATRRDMGARGRQLAQRYHWTEIAAQLQSTYMWVLGGTEMPETVQAGECPGD